MRELCETYLTVCLLVTFVGPAKTAEAVEVPFGLSRVGPRNHLFEGGADPSRVLGNFCLGEVTAHCEVLGHSAMSCAKMAELIEMPFGMKTWVGPRNNVLDWVKIPHQRSTFEGYASHR